MKSVIVGVMLGLILISGLILGQTSSPFTIDRIRDEFVEPFVRPLQLEIIRLRLDNAQLRDENGRLTAENAKLKAAQDTPK